MRPAPEIVAQLQEDEAAAEVYLDGELRKVKVKEERCILIREDLCIGGWHGRVFEIEKDEDVSTLIKGN